MNYRFYDAFINSQSNQIFQLNFIHGIINEMSQNHQFVLERSWFFCPLDQFCSFGSFSSFSCSHECLKELFLFMEDVCWFCWKRLEQENSFHLFEFTGCCRRCALFFWTCTLADLSIRSCVFQIWRNFDSLRKFSTKISQSCESFGRLHFCHLGTSLLVLLKW